MISFVDRTPLDALALGNRGLAYGDGVFETLRCRDGRWVLWDEHLARLRLGARSLGLKWSDEGEALQDFLQDQIAVGLPGSSDILVKVMLVREGGDGYRPAPAGKVIEVLILKPYVPPAAGLYQHGLDVRVLSWRLIADDQLAHLKHLNRLPQVMASLELEDGEFEGVLLDKQDFVIEGTRSSLIVCLRGRWLTPELRSAGVAGAMRSWLLQFSVPSRPFQLQVASVRRDDLHEVSSMAFCNSVFGIMPVARLQGRSLNVEAVVKTWQKPVHEELNLPWGDGC